MTEEDKGHNVYLLMWCRAGLEQVFNITESEKDAVISILTGEKPKGFHLTPLLIRARYNPDHNYEIYVIKTSTEVTEEDLFRYFDAAPEAAAEFCRKNGEAILKRMYTKEDEKI